MVPYLPDAPFPRRVTVRRLFLGNRGAQGDDILELLLDNRQRVVSRYLIDVGEVVRSRFSRIRASVHATLDHADTEVGFRRFTGTGTRWHISVSISVMLGKF